MQKMEGGVRVGLETRDSQRARILAVLSSGEWSRATKMPGHRRRAYSILGELTRQGITEAGIDSSGQSVWRLR